MTRARATPDPEFAEAVVVWQRRHGRHELPWQQSRDPYRVWLSEVMLQQTQVGTVIGYYARFVERFADVRALAAASLDEVLAQWSGLGYYSRARHLHRCARIVVEHYGGEFPRAAAALATLPGIGRSTAAAIAAFCHGERVAILDGNVARVLTRAFAFDADLSESRHQAALWVLAESLLPASDIAAYTQGLMDLGAQVCVRRRPRCDACPLGARCVSRRGGRQESYPVKTRRIRRRQRTSHLLWLEQGDRVWMVRRPPRGVWAGLWSWPEAADPSAWPTLVAGWPGRGEALVPIDHALTHFDWRLEPLRWRLPTNLRVLPRRQIESALPQGRWYTRDEALRLGLPAPIRRWLESRCTPAQKRAQPSDDPAPAQELVD